ncbi:MAG: hypothetical protein ACR2LQ_07090 [Acidimicrobiales bacterium]
MSDPQQERLDEVGAEIDQARKQAQDHDAIPDPDENHFADGDRDTPIEDPDVEVGGSPPG